MNSASQRGLLQPYTRILSQGGMKVIVSFLLLLNFINLAKADTATMAFECKPSINIGLDENCSLVLTPSMLLKSVDDPLNAYSIEVRNAYDQIVNNSFDLSDINTTFQATITLTAGGTTNNCTVAVLVEDKFGPVLTCNAGPFNVPCNAVEMIPEPTGIDNCGGVVDIIMIDEVPEYFTCEVLHGRITRTFIGVDEQGIQSAFPCVQVINLTRPNISSITAPPSIELSCNSSYLTDEAGNPAPWDIENEEKASGVPILCMPGFGIGVDCVTGEEVDNSVAFGVPAFAGDGILLPPGSSDISCNTFVSYTDQLVPSSTCLMRIQRTFTVRDWWCGGEETWTGTQYIDIVDDTAPTFICPTIVTASTKANCAADVQFPALNIDDACGSNYTVRIQIPAQLPDFEEAYLFSNGGTINLPKGAYSANYIVTDECNNVSSCTVQVVVDDTTQPVMVCNPNLTLTLPGDGSLEVEASFFNSASKDDCEIIRFEARRMSSDCNQDDVDSSIAQ